ncbi:MAG: TlpA family protein disulfide reductase [Proteobacteria bacterium]|jgi:thiol-disulfide isomerase/thioredoxin|nr:TlpA family protein disulfide reductase [Pseudomonadota bacterium]
MIRTARSFCIFFLMLFCHTAIASSLPRGIITIDNRMASAFQLVDLDSNVYTFKPASGHWQFVHFWASWCGPCRREMPTIERMRAKMKGTHLEIILVNTAEAEDTAFTFLAGIAPDLNSLLDTHGEVTEQWQPRGLPSTYLVDPYGQIRYLALGGRPWDTPVYLDFLKKLPAEK